MQVCPTKVKDGNVIGYSFLASMRSALVSVARMSALACCCALGACASVGFGGQDLEVDATTTGSITNDQTLLAGIDPSDWNILLAKISSFDAAALKAGRAQGDWDNPATGSKGRITQVKLMPSLIDRECRSFKSSMHRVTGVENIEGQICKAANGDWQITGFATGTTV